MILNRYRFFLYDRISSNYFEKEGLFMMKKITGIVLVLAFALMTIPSIALATDYEIQAMQTAEDILTAMSADSQAKVSLRDEQQNVLAEGVNSFYTDGVFNYSTLWDDYISKVYNEQTQERVRKYMQMRYIAAYVSEYGTSGTNLKSELEALDDNYDTTDLGLVASNNKFTPFENATRALYQKYSSDKSLFSASGVLAKESAAKSFDSYVKQELLNATKNLIGFVFSSEGEGTSNSAFNYSFESIFLHDDVAKKNIAVFFGKDVTTEIATGAIIENVKEYVNHDSGAVSVISNALSDIFVADKSEAISSVYDLTGRLISSAYNGKNVKDDVVRIFGNGTTEGAIELAMKVADPGEKVQNIWLNLYLRRFIQMKTIAGDFTTIDAANYSIPDTTIGTNKDATLGSSTTASYSVRNLSDYGLSDNNLSLNTSYFNVVTDSSYVSYDANKGKLYVDYDSSKSHEYIVTLTVYRSSAGTGVEDYIEDYAVKVINEQPSEGGRHNGTGSTDVSTGNNTRVKVTLVPSGDGAITGETDPITGSTNRYLIRPKAGYKVNKVYVDDVETEDYTVEDNGVVVVLADIAADHKISATFMKVLADEEHISYIIGYPDGEFKPYNSITREETATIFFRLLTDESRDKYLTESTFSDVESGRWSTQNIGTLAALNILRGYSDGSFKPSGKITRAEFAAIAYRFYNLSNNAESDAFSDISGHWANGYINAAANAGLILGYEDGTYRPDQEITRAEAVTIVNRMLSRSVNLENIPANAVTFTDLHTSDWFYCAVIESANTHDYESERLGDGSEIWKDINENPDWIKYEE